MKRRMLLKVTGCLLLSALTGCVTSSGVVPDGPDGYRILSSGDTGFTSSASLQRKAYAQAEAHCAAQGKVVETLDLQSKQSRPMGGFPEAALRFKCVSRQAQ